MAALSAAKRQRMTNPANRIGFKMGTDIVYQGGLVTALNSAGLALAGQDTASHVFLGVAAETVDNSAGATGDDAPIVEVWTDGIFEFDYASVTQAAVGTLAYILDDQTVAATGSTSNTILAGQVVEVDTTNETARVKLLQITA